MVLSDSPLQVASLRFAANGDQKPELRQSEESMGKFGRLFQGNILTTSAQHRGQRLSRLTVLRGSHRVILEFRDHPSASCNCGQSSAAHAFYSVMAVASTRLPPPTPLPRDPHHSDTTSVRALWPPWRDESGGSLSDPFQRFRFEGSACLGGVFKAKSGFDRGQEVRQQGAIVFERRWRAEL